MSNALIDSVAGFVLLAIVVMVLGYMVPTAIRSRQVVADARIEDRFSTGLRVLARAGDAPPQYNSTARVYLHTPRDGRVEAPMERQSIPPASDARTGAAAPEPDRSAEPRDPSPDAASQGPAAPGAGASGAPTPPVAKQSADEARRGAAARAARAAAASRRAAAARRRLVLLTFLAAVTATFWILFATIGLTMVPAIVASVVLVAAVIAGRRAAVRAAQAAARDLEATGWAGQRRRTTAQDSATGRHDGQQSRRRHDEPTTTQHTGQMRHARRRSTEGGAATESRSADQPGRADAGGGDTDHMDHAGPADHGPATGPEHTGQAPARTSVAGTGSLRISVDPARGEGEPEGSGAGDRGREAEGWTPVPVPKPTYALKASAPRRSVPAYEAPQWEPAPAPVEAEAERAVTLAEVEQAVRERLEPQAPPATDEQVLAEDAAGGVAPGAPDAAVAASSSSTPAAPAPKIDLQSVLERRRAVGQ